jgi:MFS family permease
LKINCRKYKLIEQSMKMKTSAANAAERRFFYGWWIVCVSTLALLVSNGLTIGGIPVFYKPIQEDLLHLGRVTKQTADQVTGMGASLTFFVSGLFSPVGGALLQKFSARRIMIVGCFILGSALFIYSRADAPMLIYTAHTLFGVSLGLVGVLPNAVLISNWFRRRRGAALGIVITGTSFGGVIIPLIAAPLIAHYGWRAAVLIVSLLVWLVLLPAVLLIVRDHPREFGLEPDGEIFESDEIKAASNVTGITLGAALRMPVFWLFGLAAAALFYPIFTTSQQFILYLQSPRIGMTAQQASFAQSALFAASVGGKFFYGWLSDRMSAARVMIFCCALMFIGTLFLFNLTTQTTLPFLILFGMGYGGTFVLIQLLAAEFFGLREIGKILGSIFVIETMGGALGSFVTGKLASSAGGDYTTAFHCVITVAAVALIAIIALSLLSRKRALRLAV